MSWSTSSIVTRGHGPPAAAARATGFSSESSPAAGSSSSATRGRPASTRATETSVAVAPGTGRRRRRRRVRRCRAGPAPLAPTRRRGHRCGSPDHDVLGDGQFLIQFDVLECAAESRPGTAVRRPPADLEPASAIRPVAGTKPLIASIKGRLAGSVGTDQTDDLTVTDLEGHVVDRGHRAVANTDGGGREQHPPVGASAAGAMVPASICAASRTGLSSPSLVPKPGIRISWM